MEKMMSQMNLAKSQPQGRPSSPTFSFTDSNTGGLTEGIRKKPAKSIILEPPPPLPLLFPESQISSTASTSTSTRSVRKKSPNFVHISDEDLAKQVATSIKRIIQRSLNEDFRQKCFQLMNVTNSEDAEVLLRNKLRSTIGIPEEIHETTMEQRMQASLARRVSKLNGLQHIPQIPLSSSVTSMLSQRELESIMPNNLALQSQSERFESQSQSLIPPPTSSNTNTQDPGNSVQIEDKSQSQSQSLIPPHTSANTNTQNPLNSVQVEDVTSSDPMDTNTSMTHVQEIRISGHLHLNEHGIPASSTNTNSSTSSSQQNSQLAPGGRKENLLKELGAMLKAEKKKNKKAKK